MGLRLKSGRRKSRLSGAVVIAYAEWMSECAAVRDAYRRWTGASEVEKPVAFVAYNAALDREEHAARRYARRLRLAGYVRQIGLAD